MAEGKVSDIEKDSPSGSIEAEAAAPAAILKHGLDADEAMKAFIGHEGERLVLDEESNRRLLRKIDLNLMPVSTLPSQSIHEIWPRQLAKCDCS